MTHSTRKRGERGSALLIVFVFAAMVAIMLYMELPVAVFEAQRQKEQLLIDRGNEYARAVKLFVRKVGTYPASIDALEKTNQIRFLRRRYKDPFTGKDDWRLLHSGPNGMLIDSKVKPVGLGQNGNAANGANMPNGYPSGTGIFGSAANSSVSGSTFGSNANAGSNISSTDTTPPEVVVGPLTQRAPAVAANGAGQTAGSVGEQNPLAPLLPGGPGEAGAGNGSASQLGQNQANQNQPNQNQPGQNQLGQNPLSQTAAGQPAGFGTGAFPQSTGSTPGTNSTGTAFGTLGGGSLAGVASKAGGHSIKTVNDQTDYSLWEFYYDPTKDATRGIAGALGGVQQNGQGQNQQQNGLGTSGPFSPDNSSTTSSPFGNSNSPNTTNPFANATGTPGINGATAPAPSPGVTPNQPQ